MGDEGRDDSAMEPEVLESAGPRADGATAHALPPLEAVDVRHQAAGGDAGPLRTKEWRGKRAFDVVGSAVLIVLLVPLLVVVALAVKLGSRGSVLFRQERAGRGGRPFRILKFRTMYADAEARLRSDPDLHRLYLASDHKLPRETDPRVTRIGRALRASSLDELPQLFNVLRGDMSLVGPRPVIASELADYGALRGSYLALRPGVTGLWQVSGRSDVKFPQRAELDTSYLLAGCLLLDVSILLRTPLVVATARGAR